MSRSVNFAGICSLIQMSNKGGAAVDMVSIDEFENLTDFIYRKTGIKFEQKKLYFISKRVEKRMKALNLSTPSEYIRHLRFNDPEGTELQHMVNSITINETYFFRDFPQLQSFAENCLVELAENKIKKGEKRLKVWSAGCSTGEEPYTLAIILEEMLSDMPRFDIEIIASDIDLNVLEKAKRGDYEQRSIRDVPKQYLAQYFSNSSNGTYKISQKIKKMVQFEHLNFSDKKNIRTKKGFDVIFCRNVLIYFDDISRKQLVDNFYAALNPGGFIFLGSSESVGRISSAFQIKRAGGYLVYYKNN